MNYQYLEMWAGKPKVKAKIPRGKDGVLGGGEDTPRVNSGKQPVSRMGWGGVVITNLEIAHLQ